jgi:hypothetical protein
MGNEEKRHRRGQESRGLKDYEPQTAVERMILKAFHAAQRFNMIADATLKRVARLTLRLEALTRSIYKVTYHLISIVLILGGTYNTIHSPKAGLPPPVCAPSSVRLDR